MSRPNLRLRFDHFRNDPSAQLLHESKTPTSAVDYYRTWKQWANDTVRDGVLGFVQPSPRLLRRRDSDVSEDEIADGEVEEQTVEEGNGVESGTGLGIQNGSKGGGEVTETAPLEGNNPEGGAEAGSTPPDAEPVNVEQHQRRRPRRSYMFTIIIILTVLYMMRKIQQHGERVFAPNQQPWLPVRSITVLPPYCAVADDVAGYRGCFGPAVYSDIVKRDCSVMQYPLVDLTRQNAVRLEQVTSAIGQAVREESAERARKLDWVKRLIGGIDARMTKLNSEGSPLRTKEDPFKAQNAIFGLLQEYLSGELSFDGSGRNVSDELWGVLNDAISLRKAVLTIATRVEKSNTLDTYYRYEIERRNGLLPGMFYAFLQHFSNEPPLETRCAEYDIRQLRQVVVASLFVEGMINSTLEARHDVRQLLHPVHNMLRESLQGFGEDRGRPVTTPQAYMDEHRAQLTSEIHQVVDYVDHVVSVEPKLFLQQQAQTWAKTTFADCVVEDDYVFEDEIPVTRLKEPVTFWEQWQEDGGEYGAVVRHVHEKIFGSNTEQEM
nr:hypothetical protein B0A51_00131 [Rachicladosporium sp. CCFEE 5018]